MTGENVQSSQGVTLVGAGSPRPQDIALSLTLAPVLVAADGGANHCVTAGHIPTAIIGDFDSLDSQRFSASFDTRMIHISEQESTDFEKCLTHIQAPFIIATGFTADRVDHSLAVWSTLAQRIGPPTVVLGEHDLILAAPDRIELDLPADTRVSLYPLATVTGRSTGLEWPIQGLTLSPMGRVGTSNRATGPVTLEFDAPGCLIILPPETLPAVLSALTG